MKNKQRGLTAIELLIVFIFLGVIAWGANVYKLTQCDFEAPYACEIIHGMGLVPVLAPFMVWVGTDT